MKYRHTCTSGSCSRSRSLSRGKFGSHPKGGRAYIPSPGAKPCPVQYCRLYANPLHRHCYPCFQKGLTQGYVILKDGSKDIVSPSKPPFAGKGGPPPRAFEAVEWPEESPPEMSNMLQDMFREWAKTKPDNPSQQESPLSRHGGEYYAARSSSSSCITCR